MATLPTWSSTTLLLLLLPLLSTTATTTTPAPATSTLLLLLVTVKRTWRRKTPPNRSSSTTATRKALSLWSARPRTTTPANNLLVRAHVVYSRWVCLPSDVVLHGSSGRVVAVTTTVALVVGVSLQAGLGLLLGELGLGRLDGLGDLVVQRQARHDLVRALGALDRVREDDARADAVRRVRRRVDAHRHELVGVGADQPRAQVVLDRVRRRHGAAEAAGRNDVGAPVLHRRHEVAQQPRVTADGGLHRLVPVDGRVQRVRHLRLGVVAPDDTVADAGRVAPDPGGDLGRRPVHVQAGQRREVRLGQARGGLGRDQAVRVGRVGDDHDLAVRVGVRVQRLARRLEDGLVLRQQVLAFHAGAAREPADQDRDLHARVRLGRVRGRRARHDQRVRAVVDLHGHARQRLGRRRYVQQDQVDGLRGAQRLPRRDQRDQAVPDLAGRTRDQHAHRRRRPRHR
ncbi:hypothetical protein PBRA_008171 [Plasmodiophora brassicae]|uniref:Secreted protein n=1 Tax=Plasmodiophora brassicae TaxID=37360 RepID=A0A0G4J0I4_PLABS|nr:hypothetical protein PBRA_008171 [Plasmodiophora brassicae]